MSTDGTEAPVETAVTEAPVDDNVLLRVRGLKKYFPVKQGFLKRTTGQLQAVDGISEALAIQIIDRRKTQPFTSVSELIELDGVDKALLAKVRPSLAVGPPK